MDPAKLKVVELRAALAERGLDTKGNKPVLVERLRKALEEEEDGQGFIEERSTVDCAEDIGDTALKEASERYTETTRSSQSPRTPSRSSRSSTMTTSPTKISTRNASRTVTTPNSSKQPSLSKFQYVEEEDEEGLTISQSTSEEFVVQEEISKLSPDKYRGEEKDNASNIVQNEIYMLSSKSQEQEAKHINVFKDDRCEANVSQVPVTELSEKSSIIESIDQSPRSREKYEMKESRVDEVRKLQQSIARPMFIPADNITKLEEKMEIKTDVDIDKVKDIEDKISIQKKNIEYIEDSYNIKDKVDIPKIEQPVIPDQIDRMCDIEMKDKGKINDEYTVREEKKNVSVDMGNTNENVDNIDISQDKQAAEVKQEDVKILEVDESNQKKDSNDRKRKRSPSPAEDQRCQESPISFKPEDEPDLDDSAVTLSWYDSDLNLIINKDGFFSATPMHNDNFRHVWAGARASYGFGNGKVYYETKITEHITTKDEQKLHMFRIGWSAPNTSMQLGEEKFSYAYTNDGKKGTDKEFTDYGLQFGKDDVVGCYLDMTPENTVELSYTINGKDLGFAFSISKDELGDRPLFPHILSKNCTFVCNFGQEDAWFEQISEYTLAGNIELKDRVVGPRRPDGKEECEVIMVCGLPGAGKTTWAKKHAAEYPGKLYNILGFESLIAKTGYQEQNQSERQANINKCQHALNGLLDIASSRRRNYILDQRSNVNYWTQRHKMRIFCGYQRKAIIVVPQDEEYNQRLSTYDLTKNNLDPNTELKPNFDIPSVGELFDTVEWVGLDEEKGKKFIEKHNNERVGVSQQQLAKRPRYDKTEGNRETRDSRNNRDYRDRRNNYQDRGRSYPWRGGNMGGWRGERPQRGGYMRHIGGYGPHPVPWRLRGRGNSAMRGVDRRGGIDRRSGNDRNRPVAARQGGWGPMSNYQGSQQSGWGQQDNWSSSQSQGSWGQQSGGWAQQGSWGGGSWKGYGQGTYSQTGYSQQQGYGNGNWNNWNQQYYNNQYWGQQQQQQSGQITAAGSQAVSKQ